MIINLLSNAIKFTESGTVTVTAQKREKAEVRRQKENLASTSHNDTADRQPPTADTLSISVSDTGKGIPAEELPTLFDEYRQVEGQSESKVQKGTGLAFLLRRNLRSF